MNNKVKTLILGFPLFICFNTIVHSQIDSTSQDTVFFPFVTNYNKDRFIDYDIMPQFQGGEDGLINYIVSNLIYPPTAIKDSISGIVILYFVVDTSGSVTGITFLQNLREDIDNECTRMLNEMPRWQPASTIVEAKKGYYRKVVPGYFSLRLNFTLNQVRMKNAINIIPK